MSAVRPGKGVGNRVGVGKEWEQRTVGVGDRVGVGNRLGVRKEWETEWEWEKSGEGKEWGGKGVGVGKEWGWERSGEKEWQWERRGKQSGTGVAYLPGNTALAAA